MSIEFIECKPHFSIIEQLLVKPFFSRSFPEKVSIVANRPCPELPELTTVHKTKKEEYVRRFSVNQYKLVWWLAGCENNNKLYCWPCLLFRCYNTESIWVKMGFSDLNHLTVSVQKHEKSVTHVTAALKFKMFGKQSINVELDDKQLHASISLHNENVRKNREILKRLIMTTCYLGKQELTFGGHNELADSLNNKGNYQEFLETIREIDPLLDIYFGKSTIFCDSPLTIQNDIIKAVNTVLMKEIKKQINASNYMSIMLDETENLDQLSVVLRYFYEGTLYERFIKFINVNADKKSEGLFEETEKIIEDIEIGKKLVGQTYDGAAVMAGHLNDLQSKVLEKYPKAIFTHCWAHILNLVLHQSVSNILECRIFFQLLNGLAAFFTQSPKHTQALQEFVQNRIPTVAPTTWNFTSRLTNTVQQFRLQLIDFFGSITESSFESPHWDSETLIKAQGFVVYLKKFDTILLLEICSVLFNYTDILYNILQTNQFNIFYCSQKVIETLRCLEDERSNFDSIWTKVTSQIANTKLEKRRKKNTSISPEAESRCLFNEIIDNICLQIRERYDSLKKLEFFNLLNFERFKAFKGNFPTNLLEKVQNLYSEYFDFIRLKNELTVVYNSKDFENKPIYDLIKFMQRNDLNVDFKEVFKLATIILTIPYSTPPSVECSFSALKRVKTYTRATLGQDRLSELALISIEKELLCQLQKNKDEFNASVIDEFLQQEKRMDFIFK